MWHAVMSRGQPPEMGECGMQNVKRATCLHHSDEALGDGLPRGLQPYHDRLPLCRVCHQYEIFGSIDRARSFGGPDERKQASKMACSAKYVPSSAFLAISTVYSVLAALMG